MQRMEETQCQVCKVPAKQSCSSCHSSFYCSKECQKRDWKNHKGSCIPYVIEVHPVYGRYTVATRDIAAGEIIMKEIPLLVGPQNHTKPICLGCHRGVTGSYCCSKCNHPLCSSTCEESPIHEAECQLLSKAKCFTCIESLNEVNPAYSCILPLRCLLLKYTDPKKWKIFSNLQDSVEKLSVEKRKMVQANIIDYIKNFMNFKGVDPSEIYRVCGILHTNSFEVIHNGTPVEGVFPKVAMMPHDCTPNTENVFKKNLQAVVRTTVPIPKGAAITTTYTNLIWNTPRRRSHLLKSKFFECDCVRCSDPTERGSNIGTLICSQCGGHVSSTAPLDLNAIWCCRECNYTIASKDVERTNKILYKAFCERDRSKLCSLDDLIESCKERLHPHHQIVMEAKFAWIKFSGNHPEYRYKEISKAQLHTKISYCRELLKTFDVLFPGRSQFRGFLLYELHASLFAMAHKLLSFGDLNNESVQVYMDEAENSLQESKNIFYFENEMTDRGFSEKLSLLRKEFETN